MNPRSAGQGTTMLVYLIHFDAPVRGKRHYIGSTENLPRRLAFHREGNGLVYSARKAGVSWRVSRVWEGQGPRFEHKLKAEKNLSRHCPNCAVKEGRDPVPPKAG